MGILGKKKLSYRETWGAVDWEKEENPLLTIQNILEAGADINAKDAKGRTILYELLRNQPYNDNYKKAFDYLIDKGADVNIQTEFGSPLYFAVVSNNRKLVKKLLEKKANPNIACNGSGYMTSPLGGAKDLKMVDLLCQYGAKPNFEITKEKGRDGKMHKYTALSEHIERYFHGSSDEYEKMHKAIVTRLIQYGGDIETKAESRTLLAWAIYKGEPSFVLTLLKMGAKKDTKEVKETLAFAQKYFNPSAYQVIQQTLDLGEAALKVPRPALRALLKNASSKSEQKRLAAILAQGSDERQEKSDKIRAQRRSRDAYEATKRKMFEKTK